MIGNLGNSYIESNEQPNVFSFCYVGFSDLSRSVFDMEKILYRNTSLKIRPLLDFSQREHFVPVHDGTDHFSFACSTCREIANILMVERSDCYAHTPTIYFWLYCPVCHRRGFRKIYLEDTDKHQLRFPVETKLLANMTEDA